MANTNEKKTPYEIFFGVKPCVKNLRLYGSRVYVRVPEVRRRSKWDKKAELGVLLGYTEVGYKILINNRVVVARHVDIVEENVKYIRFNGNEEKEKIQDKINKTIKENQSLSDESEKEPEQDKLVLRRSTRERRRPTWQDEQYVYNTIHVNYCNGNVPETYEEAITCSDSRKWKEAMDREMKSLQVNKTWTVVKKPTNKQVIDVKWIFKIKANQLYKARVVARGFQQEEVIGNTYSPVAKIQTLKVLLSVCCNKNMYIDQMDVETDFLNGKVNYEIYVRQPQGYEDDVNKVCKLNKSLYGLKESPRTWYDCFDEFLTSLGFDKSKFYYCLYTRKGENNSVYILIFVDNVLICSESRSELIDVKNKLSNKFVMKDLSKVKNYVGIEIDYDKTKNSMTLNLRSFIEILTEK